MWVKCWLAKMGIDEVLESMMLFLNVVPYSIRKFVFHQPHVQPHNCRCNTTYTKPTPSTGAEPSDAEPSDAAPPASTSSPLRTKSKAFDNALASVTKEIEAGPIDCDAACGWCVREGVSDVGLKVACRQVAKYSARYELDLFSNMI